MTSPKEPPKSSVRDRLTRRTSTNKRGRAIDAEAEHTRNVSWLFYGLIVVIVVVVVGGLLYGFWESNLKPVASVSGSDVSRADLNDRSKLLQFRFDRANAQTSAALADGTIDADLANRRFSTADSELPGSDAEALVQLVDLLYMSKLAGEEGVSLSDDELESAVAADGTFPEARRLEAVIVLTPEQEQGLPATDAGIADARERAAGAVAALEAGDDPADVAETFGPANHETAWVTYEDLVDAAWADEIFAAEQGGVTPAIESDTGEQLIALVTDIVPEQPDAGFLEAVKGAVGEDVHRRQVGLEALAEKLERQIADEAVAADREQVELAEIFIERSSSSTDDTVGEARASHILYEPETPLDADGNPTAVADLPDDDPAWDAAEAEAQAAFDELTAIEDVDERKAAFAERAMAESDGPTGPNGGDLGWFSRESMVPEFSDAIWENVDPQEGDILGPVRTQFGWHVILFDGFRSSLDVRVSDVQQALAQEGADFATVAEEYSDAPDAPQGGYLGWQVLDLLDDQTVLALSTVDVGGSTEPIDGGDGYRIFQKLAEESRPLSARDAADVRVSAFDEWYNERYSEAEADGTITIDDAIYEQ